MSGVPGLEMHHGLLAARGGGNLLLSVWHLFKWKPAVIAVAAWIGYAVFAGVASTAAATPDTVREVRAQCSALAQCELGAGKVLATQDVSYKKQASAFAQGAGVFRSVAVVATIGALTVAVLGAAGQRNERRRTSRVMDAARRVKAEHDRARRDVDRVNRAATKLGQRRLEAAGKRWARQDAAGEARTDLGRIDRALIGKRVAPPKQAKKKGRGRKGRRAMESEWAAELARIDAARSEPTEVAHLDPGDGPPEPPDRSPSPQIAVYRAQAADVEARTTGTMRGLVKAAHEGNGWVGYEPPAAPVTIEKEARP